MKDHTESSSQELNSLSKEELINIIRNREKDNLTFLADNLGIFDEALSASGIAVWEWDLRLSKARILSKSLVFLGHPVDKLNVGFEVLLQHVHEDDRSTVDSGVERYINAYPENHVYEFRMKDVQGNFRWVMSVGKVSSFGEDGRPHRVVGVIREVTQKVKNENRIGLSQFALEHAGDQIIRIDSGGIIREVNRSAARVLGVISSELIGQSANKLPYFKDFDDHKWLGFWNRVKLEKLVVFESKFKNAQSDLTFHEYACNYCQFRHEESVYVFGRDITERKMSLRQLAKNEQRFRILSDMAKEGILIHRDGIIMEINLAIEKISGYKREEVIGNEINRFLTHSEASQIDWNAKSPVTYEFSMVRKDGKEIDIEVVAKPYGKAQRVAIVNDITQRKKAERELLNYQEHLQTLIRERTAELEERNISLQKKEREYRTLLLNLQGMAYRSLNDSRWTALYVSDGCKELTGYEVEDFISGEIIFEIHCVDQKYADDIRKTINQALNNHEPFQISYPITTKNGEKKWVHERGLGVYDEDGQLLTLEGVIVDITNEKEKDFQLRLAQETIDKAPISIEWLNQSGEFIYVNETAAEYTGYSQHELLSKKVYELNPTIGKEDWEKLFMDMGSKDVKGYLTTRLRKGNGEFPVEINSTNIIYEGREYNCAYLTDITERRKTEVALMEAYENLSVSEKKLKSRSKELDQLNSDLNQQKNALENTIEKLKAAQNQLVQSEKMASLGVLVAGIAHELNNPISYIMSGGEAIRYLLTDINEVIEVYEKFDEKNPVKSMELIRQSRDVIDFQTVLKELGALLENITEGAEQAAEIVRGLRSFSRIDGGDLKRHNIHKSIELILTMLKSNYKNRVRIHKNFKQLPDILCYPLKLNQVFMNLISNALQSIKSEGSIHISTSLSDRYGDEFVAIEIKDDGCGIPTSIQNRIFEPFFTTKDVGEGTGLGLSISLGIVKDHQGLIDFKSEEGIGSEFTVYLPVNQ